MEEKELFSIGEVAKLYNMSVGNLRHYEKIGILIPEYINPDSGYRYYSVKQFESLNTIRYLRALDMSLEKIKLFLKNRNTDNLHDILLEHQKEVDKKRYELDMISKKIQYRIKKLQDALVTEVDKIAIIEIEKRRFAILKTSIIPNNYLSLEGSIRKLDASSNNIFLGKVGVGLTKESLYSYKFTPYEFVFLILDEEDTYSGNTVLVDKEKCVRIRFRGGHENAGDYYKKLLTYIENNDLKINGFSKEITMIDYGITNDESQFVTEIQIPII